MLHETAAKELSVDGEVPYDVSRHFSYLMLANVAFQALTTDVLKVLISTLTALLTKFQFVLSAATCVFVYLVKETDDSDTHKNLVKLKSKSRVGQ